MTDIRDENGLWLPGKSANPSGRPKLPAQLQQFKNLSYQEFLFSLQKYGSVSMKELRKLIEEDEVGGFEMISVRAIVQAADGNHIARQMIVERLWGKVREMDDSLDVTKLSNTELIQMAKDSLRILEAPTVQIEVEK